MQNHGESVQIIRMQTPMNTVNLVLLAEDLEVVELMSFTSGDTGSPLVQSHVSTSHGLVTQTE